jgi:hypothetical protein
MPLPNPAITRSGIDGLEVGSSMPGQGAGGRRRGDGPEGGAGMGKKDLRGSPSASPQGAGRLGKDVRWFPVKPSRARSFLDGFRTVE